MASTSLPLQQVSPDKKRKKNGSENTKTVLQVKRRKEQTPSSKAQTVPKPPLPGAYFIPYLQGTIRILDAGSPNFIASQAHAEALIGYNFKQPALLLEALYPVKNEWARIGSGLVLKEANYRMALIGDAVLKMAILDARFDLPELNGITDSKVQTLVSDEHLASMADKNGIASYLVGWYARGSAPSKKAKATTVEAIIGAVWYDSGKDLEVVKKILPKLLGEKLDEEVVMLM